MLRPINSHIHMIDTVEVVVLLGRRTVQMKQEHNRKREAVKSVSLLLCVAEILFMHCTLHLPLIEEEVNPHLS